MVKKQISAEKQLAIVVVCIVVFLAIVVVGIMGFDQVDANHRGVRVRLGKVLGPMEAGIQWTGLFTSTYQYDLRIRKETIEMEGNFNAPDKTGQPVYARIDVNYRIKPDSVVEMYKNVGKDGVIADRLNINPIIAEGFKQATVKYDALEILDKRQEVKELAKENIRNNFPEEFFTIVDIVVSNIHFSANFQNALDAKKTAIELANVAKEDLERVKFEQAQEVEKYKAEAEKLRLQKSEITPLLVQQKWIEQWNGQLPLYMLTTSSQMETMLVLPDGVTQ